MALAKAFGFSSHMVHGSWGNIPHVWANVHGVGEIDATAIQNGYGLFASSKVRGAGPIHRPHGNGGDDFGSTTNNTFNINISVENSNPKDNEELGEMIGDIVVDKVIKLTRVNPSTGI